MISNPRYSTFARLSPTDMNAYPYTFPSIANNFPPEMEAQAGAEAVTTNPPTPRRVTVHYDGSTAPELAVRFSGLYMPPAEELTAVFHRRGTILATIPQSALPAPASFTNSSMRGMRGHTDLSSGSDTRSLYTTVTVPWPSLESDTPPRSLRDVGGSRRSATNRRPVTSYSQRTNTEFTSETRNKQLLVAALRDFVGNTGSTNSNDSSSDTIAQRQAPTSRDDEQRRPERRRLRRASAATGANVSVDTASVSTQSGEGADTRRKPSQTSLGSARRKAMPIPPPIDASIAGPDVDLMAKVQITATSPTALGEEGGKHSPSLEKQRREVDRSKSINTSVKDKSRRRTVSSGARMGTPGMTLASSSPRTDTDIQTGRYGSVRTGGESVAADPFGSGESYYGEQDYRMSELAGAESGLGRIASRVAQFDRQRRQSYRGLDEPSPNIYSPFALPTDRKGKGKARARTSTQPGPESAYAYGRRGSGPTPPERALVIGRPRHLSARTTSSGSSPLTGASGIISPRDSWAPTLESARHERVTAAWRTASRPTTAGRTHVHTFSDASFASAASSADALERHAARERELVRIKSVGRVSTRQTPTPSPSSFPARNSMRAESSDYSISNFAAADGSLAGSPSPQRLVRPYRRSTDSNSVLGMGSSLRS